MKCTRVMIGLIAVGVMIVQGYSTNVMAEIVTVDLGEVVVPGNSNPWLAGMPDGTLGGDGSDSAPADSPVLVDLVPGLAGSWLEFPEVTGTTSNAPWRALVGPEGKLTQMVTHRAGAEHAKASLTAPISGLIGVFLDSDIPSGSTPPPLNFGTAASREYLELSPSLSQPFWIGDGVTRGNINQKVFVPNEAMRLFLGTMDGYDWYHNPGALNVAVAQMLDISPLDISIDIKPGSDRNPVNLKSKGKLPVVVFGSDELDVSMIDLATLLLNGVGLPEKNNGRLFASLEDEDGDGILDLVMHFTLQDLGIEVGMDELLMSGSFLDGSAFEGSDVISIVGFGDANGDGVVSADDYASVQANFESHLPEPATLSLLAVGVTILLKRKHKSA